MFLSLVTEAMSNVGLSHRHRLSIIIRILFTSVMIVIMDYVMHIRNMHCVFIPYCYYYLSASTCIGKSIIIQLNITNLHYEL